MATPPTFIQEAETTWTAAASPKASGNFTTQTGDVVVAAEATEDGAYTPSQTGTNVTLTSQQEVLVANYATAEISAGIVSSGGTTSVSFERTGGGSTFLYGGNALTFRGSDGIGASAKANTTGAPSLSITTTQDNSAIVVIISDWNAADGTTRTWRTVNSITPTAGNGYELTYFRDSAHYSVYVAYYPDAGAAGTKTVGLSAPSGQKYSIVALEVKGAAASGASGTMAATGGTDTMSASGTTTITGTLAKTNANDSMSAVGTTAVNGTMAVTNTGDTMSASGAPGSAVTGSMAATGGNDTMAAAGGPTLVGSAAMVEGRDTMATAGTTTILGTLARTNQNDTMAASGTSGTATASPPQLPVRGAGS